MVRKAFHVSPTLLSNGSVAQVLRLCCFSAVAALVGAGVENEATSAAVSAVTVAHPTESIDGTSTPVQFSSPLLRLWNSSLSLWIDRSVGRLTSWLYDEPRRLQPGTDFPCRPSRRPGEYDIVNSVPPEWITPCVPLNTKELFGENQQIVDLTFANFGGLEVLMVTQKRGPVRQFEIVTTGDYAHYKANSIASRTFRGHSCLNKDLWCFVAQARPVESGFLVVDRHRVIHYNYTWLVEGNTLASEVPDVFVSQFGLMNNDGQDISENDKLNFPTSVAEYVAYNSSLVALSAPALAGVTGEQFEITSLIPHAADRLLFITDTGNHRVVMMNASYSGQFDYIGQYGFTGEATSNSTGFNWPWGVAVYAPAWEGRYEPTYANVFVVDRRNHRLVKLNLGYPLLPCEMDVEGQVGPILYDEDKRAWMCRRHDKPRLTYSAEYGREQEVFGKPEGLTDPTAVSIYEHYIVVAELAGNAITVLRVDHQPPYGLKLVSYFKPQPGLKLQGSMSASPFGYVWFNYIDTQMRNTVSAMFLPEPLRESSPPSRFKDFLAICVNTSWYDDLMSDKEKYLAHVGFILNASVINYMYPDEPDYFDVMSFNSSSSNGGFDFDLLNYTIHNGSMRFCDPPTTPPPPPFFGGNEDGWVIDGKSQSEFTRRSGAYRSSRIGIAFTASLAFAFSL